LLICCDEFNPEDIQYLDFLHPLKLGASRRVRYRLIHDFGKSASGDSAFSFIADLNPRMPSPRPLPSSGNFLGPTPTALFPESLTGAWVETDLRTSQLLLYGDYLSIRSFNINLTFYNWTGRSFIPTLRLNRQ